MLTSLQNTSRLETKPFKVGDVFESIKKDKLPVGEKCPFFELEVSGISCHDYFGDEKKVFKITSVINNIVILSEEPSDKAVVIPSNVLQFFLKKKCGEK